METAPTSIEVLLRPTQSQSDEPSDLRGSLSPTSVYNTWQSQAVTHPIMNRARRCLTSVIEHKPLSERRIPYALYMHYIIFTTSMTNIRPGWDSSPVPLSFGGTTEPNEPSWPAIRDSNPWGAGGLYWVAGNGDFLRVSVQRRMNRRNSISIRLCIANIYNQSLCFLPQPIFNPFKVEISLYKPWRSTVWNHHKCLSQLFPLHSNTYVMGRCPLYIFYSYNAGIDFWRKNLLINWNLILSEH